MVSSFAFSGDFGVFEATTTRGDLTGDGDLCGGVGGATCCKNPDNILSLSVSDSLALSVL